MDYQAMLDRPPYCKSWHPKVQVDAYKRCVSADRNARRRADQAI